MKSQITASILLCIASHAHAASTAWDLAEDKKTTCSQGNMRQMNQCLADEYVESDTHLNAVYNHLLRSLLDPKPLKKAQIAWIRFRDLECDFQVPPSSIGSEVPYSRHACLIHHTERRILDLENIRPCNGCVEFKPEIYKAPTPFRPPSRHPIPHQHKSQ